MAVGTPSMMNIFLYFLGGLLLLNWYVQPISYETRRLIVTVTLSKKKRAKFNDCLRVVSERWKGMLA